MKTINTKFKVGDTFYKFDDAELKTGTVDKIEVFKDYFRYVNESKECLTNWFTNEQIDNEPDLEEGEAQMERIFTTKEKAMASKWYKRARIFYLIEKIKEFNYELEDLVKPLDQ